VEIVGAVNYNIKNETFCIELPFSEGHKGNLYLTPLNLCFDPLLPGMSKRYATKVPIQSMQSVGRVCGNLLFFGFLELMFDVVHLLYFGVEKTNDSMTIVNVAKKTHTYVKMR
jgi:hypothetical protein